MSGYNLVGQIIVPRNIDCVKVCPLDSTLLAIAFYQQLPELTGGIALHSLTCPLETLSNIVIEDYGPILHLCWLDRIINDSYYLFAAARNGRVLIIEVRVDVLKPSLELKGELTLQPELADTFCLYIDCQFFNNTLTLLVSTSNSLIHHYTLDDSFRMTIFNIDPLSHTTYNNVQPYPYSIWTCRYTPYPKTFVIGDEVNTLYRYCDGKMVEKNSVSHLGGICDVGFIGEFGMFSGGFDGVVCRYDWRMMGKEVWRVEYGGTCWRVIPRETAKGIKELIKGNEEILVCNSSEKEFVVVDGKDGQKKWTWKGESLAYAGEWIDRGIIGATFYDRVVKVWQEDNAEKESEKSTVNTQVNSSIIN